MTIARQENIPKIFPRFCSDWYIYSNSSSKKEYWKGCPAASRCQTFSIAPITSVVFSGLKRKHILPSLDPSTNPSGEMLSFMEEKWKSSTTPIMVHVFTFSVVGRSSSPKALIRIPIGSSPSPSRFTAVWFKTMAVLSDGNSSLKPRPLFTFNRSVFI